MIVALIIACEVGFWVLLALALAVRYLLKWRRTSVVLLLCEPVLELVLFAVTAVDLKNGAEPGWEHGLAALYIGFTVGYGHYTIRWLDGHAAHRLGGAPKPAGPPKYGLARARHEGELWVRTLVAAGVALVLLQGAVWYVGDDGNAESLRAFQWTAIRAAGIHGLVALAYLIWPKKEPGPGPKSVPGAESDSDPGPESESVPGAESDSDPGPESESVPGPKPEPERAPAQEKASR